MKQPTCYSVWREYTAESSGMEPETSSVSEVDLEAALWIFSKCDKRVGDYSRLDSFSYN